MIAFVGSCDCLIALAALENEHEHERKQPEGINSVIGSITKNLVFFRMPVLLEGSG